MSNLTASQIAVNINFSGLHGERATWSTVMDVKNAYFYGDGSVTSLDLLRSLSRGERVLRGEERYDEADTVRDELANLRLDDIFTVNDYMDLYIEEHGAAAAASQF